MDQTTAEDPEAGWIALLCAGVLLTALAATVSVGIIALYAPRPADLQPVLACFAAGALLMLAAAAGLERANVARVRTERR
jgi:hypothetical protein